MMRRLVGLTICSFIAFGCGDDDGGTDDAGDTSIVLDGGEDSGSPDTGRPDTESPDTGPTECTLGGAVCTAARGCASRGAECLEERVDVTGMAPDGIEGLPGGDTSFSNTIWTDGVCVEQGLPTATGPFACDREDPAACGDCQTCLEFDTQGFCLPSCDANIADNDVCRDTYACGRGDNGERPNTVCVPGCSGDLECNVRRVETNGIPGIQSQLDCEDEPADCDGSMTNFDRLQYDTESPNAVCNMDSFQCDDPDRDADSLFGSTCTADEQCPDEDAPGYNSFCIEESTDTETGFVSWEGGVCTKVGCDLDGNGCGDPEDAICQERGLGVALCLSGCTVGAGADPEDPATWIADGAGSDDCPRSEGGNWGCVWGGVGAHGVERNGACVPTEFSQAVTEPNTGATCEEDVECFSPFGNGFCLTGDGFPEGYCSVRDAASPYFAADSEANICGEGSSIVAGFGGDPTFALCLLECETADDCAGERADDSQTLGCIPLTMGGPSHCFPGCDPDVATSCATGYSCTPDGEFFECTQDA